MAVEAELRRRDVAANLADWVLVADAANTATALSDPVIDYQARSLLSDIKALLTTISGLDYGTETTLALIEDAVDGLEAALGTTADASTADTVVGLLKAAKASLDTLDGVDYATQATLSTVLTTLQGTLDVTGTVTVDNHPSEFPLPSAQVTSLRDISDRAGRLLGEVSVNGDVALDAATLAALETISVANFPATYALPSAQVTTLTPQTDALTDAQLRAAAIATAEANPGVTPVTGTKSTSGDETIIAAPGAGSFLRLWLLHATPDSDNSTFPRIIFKSTGGTERFRGSAIQHSRYYLDLPDNEGLVLNLDAAAAVNWTVHYTTETT